MLASVLGLESATLASWRLHRIDDRPGAGSSAGYDVMVQRPGAEDTREYLVASSAPVRRDPPGVVTVEGSDGAFSVWRFPHDPALPALASLCDVRAASQRLLEPGQVVDELQVMTYRPMRRAVMRIGSGGRRCYAKVVRPAKLTELAVRHRLLADAGLLAPRILRADADGMLLVDEVREPSLAQILAETALSGAPLPDPEGIVELLGRLPRAIVELRRRPSWASRSAQFAVSARWLAGGDIRVDELVARIQRALAGSDSGPVVATHGDLNTANLVHSTRSDTWGLLDLDTVGPGHLVDDLACLVAHLVALEDLDPGAYPNAPDFRDRCLAVFDRVVDPAGLRAHAAAVLLSLAAGAPDRALGRAWLRRAREMVRGLSA